MTKTAQERWERYNPKAFKPINLPIAIAVRRAIREAQRKKS